MTAQNSDTVPPDLPPWARRAIDVVRIELGAGIDGLYLFGSAVTTGLQPGSDLDLLALVRSPVEPSRLQRLTQRLLGVSNWSPVSRSGQAVELTVLVTTELTPWRYPPRRHFQFGEWLRPELERGHIAPPFVDPDVVIMLATVQAASVTLAGQPLSQLIAPVPSTDVRRAMLDCLPNLLRGLEGDERNVILTLARMWVTLVSNEIVPKHVAADRLLAMADARHHAALVLARDAYLGKAEDDWRLFDREAREFVHHAASQIEQLSRG